MSNPFKDGAGGRPGGLGTFFLGLLMSLGGGYMLLTTVRVTTGFWSGRIFGGVSPFGALMFLFILGVLVLFYDADRWLGWLLAGGSLLAILIGVIVNLQVYFQSTTLLVTLIMFVLLFGGVGLMLRALR